MCPGLFWDPTCRRGQTESDDSLQSPAPRSWHFGRPSLWWSVCCPGGQGSTRRRNMKQLFKDNFRMTSLFRWVRDSGIIVVCWIIWFFLAYLRGICPDREREAYVRTATGRTRGNTKTRLKSPLIKTSALPTQQTTGPILIYILNLTGGKALDIQNIDISAVIQDIRIYLFGGILEVEQLFCCSPSSNALGHSNIG